MSEEHRTLYDAFEELMVLNGVTSVKARAPLFRVFCVGAATYNNILHAALRSGLGDEHVNQVQNDMAAEITAATNRSATH